MSEATFGKIATLSIAFMLGTAAIALAQERGYQPPPQTPTVEYQKKVLTPGSTEHAVRQEMAVPLSEAVELAKKSDLKGALVKAQQADGIASDKSAYEEYVVSKLIGTYAGQLGDNKAAAAGFDRALASSAMPAEERPQMLRITMGLNINAGNYVRAVSLGEELQKLGKADGDALSDLSLAYYMKGDFQSARKVAQTSINAQSATGKQPHDQTLKILLNSQIKTGDQRGARQTQDRLCAMTPPPSDVRCPPRSSGG